MESSFVASSRLLSVFALVACASCIAWRGTLSHLDPRELSKPEHPRALTFEVDYLTNGAAKESSTRKATDAIQDALERTHLFASVEPSTERGGLHLVFHIEERVNEGAANASAFLCSLTLFVLPAFASAEYSLEADLFDAEHGGLRRSSGYLDELHFAMEILLLPATPFFWPPRVKSEVVSNLALHAVAELLSSGEPRM